MTEEKGITEIIESLTPILAMLGINTDEIMGYICAVNGYLTELTIRNQKLEAIHEDNNMMLNYLCSLLDDENRLALHNDLQNLRKRRKGINE